MKLKALRRASITILMAALLLPSAGDAHGRHGRERDPAFATTSLSRPVFEPSESRRRDEDRSRGDVFLDQQRTRRAALREREPECRHGGVGSLLGAIAGGLIGNGDGRRTNAASRGCD